jgi:hypothetical protein
MALEEWRLLDFGPLDPLDTQIIYDVVAQAITEKKADNTLIICWPERPIVCLGYFQEADKDVDLAFCHSNRIIVTRRVIGGGGVYLDDIQSPSIGNGLAHIALVARLALAAGLGLGAVDSLGQYAPGAGLASAARAAE